MKPVALASLAVLLFTACKDRQPLQPPSGRPSALIMDGAHHGGNADFFFLPPLTADPTGGPNFDPGKFNPNLSPSAEVCTLTGDPAAGAVDCATDQGRPVLVFGPQPMVLGIEQYQVTWDTKSPTLLDASKFYRIIVRGAPRGTMLGLLDVDPVTNGLKNVKTGEVAQFQDGRTVPIKVRIEQGAFGVTNPDHVEATVTNAGGTITTNTGFAGASFPDNWLPAAAVSAGISQVVVIIERVPVDNSQVTTSCLQSGLLEMEGCYRFRTDPDLKVFGQFNKDVTAGVCFEIPSVIGTPAAPPFQLYRREDSDGLFGPTIPLEDVAAPFVHCETFTRTPSPSPGITSSGLGRLRDLASAGWDVLASGIARVLTPRTAYAVDLGAGGLTKSFSHFGWARAVAMTKDLTTDNQVAVTGTRVPRDPKVCLVTTHPTPGPNALPPPLAREPVTFTVTPGVGTVGGAAMAVVNTGDDGCASAPWVLGSTTAVGGNALTVAAAALPGTVLFTATGVTISATATDPSGDAATDSRVVTSPDLISMTATAAGGTLTLSVRFAPGTFDSQTTEAEVLLDTDQNPTTGSPGSDAGGVHDAGIIGVDYLMRMGSALNGSQARVFQYAGTPNSFTAIGSTTVTFVTDGMDVTIPLSLLGHDDGQMNIKVTTAAQVSPTGSTGVLDYMPDVGVAATALVIPQPCLICGR